MLILLCIWSHHITSHHITSHHITSHHITSHHSPSTKTALPNDFNKQPLRKLDKKYMEELQTVVQEFKDVDPERERKGIDMWDVCTADNLVAYDMNNQGGIFPRFSFGVKGDTKRLKRFAPDCKRIETLQIKKSIISRWYSDKDSGTV
jgi:hypothetical protein